MNFSLANRAPIGVTIDGQKHLIPRFRRRDFLDWAAEIDGKRLADATADMSPTERGRFLSIYPIAPVDHSELFRQVYTPAGTEKIVRTCMTRANIPANVIEKTLDECSARDLATLASLLASIVDPVEASNGEAVEEEGGQEDPLASAKKGSAG